MAYINATLWNDLQASDATNEKRFAELGIIDAVKASTGGVDYIPPSVKAALRSISSLRGYQIPVIKDQTIVVNQTPGFNSIPSNLAETANYTGTTFDVFSGFRHYPAAHDNNQVDSDYMRAQTMKNVAYAMANTVETIMSTRLEARKTQALGYTTQVSQGDGTFSFDTTPDVLNINKAAQKETMFYNLEQLMNANEIGGGYGLVTSRGGMAVQRSEAAKYGANNDKNLKALGFLDSSRLHESGNISAGSDVFNGYFLRDGSIGVYENFPSDFRSGTVIGEKKWSVSDVELPFAKLRANIYTDRTATDATALITSGNDSNLTMAHFEEMGIWLRFTLIERYNSAIGTRVNDIIKVSGKTT